MFTSERRRRRTALRLLIPILGVLVPWFSGLLWFAETLPGETTNSDRETDAIVVLTGGSGRLTQGLELLAQGRARKLFVSGVYHGVDITELFRIRQESPDEFACCVVLGYEADDTQGNALETAAWMEESGYNSLRLVTATYHMPRSLLEFRNVLPDAEIIPHSVFPANFRRDDWWRWPGSASLVATEFNKYLVAWVRTTLSGLVS